MVLVNPLTRLDKSWQEYFSGQLSQPYMQNLLAFVEQEYSQETIYPPHDQVWSAFKLTSLKNVRVVIMGQDPYHGANQANGLAFSVQDNIKIPPSLKNIFKELNRDLGFEIPDSGNLQAWAEQGVLLLNSCLTVREGLPASHGKQGWEQFTQGCIDYLNDHKEKVVFLAWGRFAHDVCAKVDKQKHCVIKTSHPSPLGATKQGKEFDAFLGSGCFSKANAYLEQHQQTPISWNLAQHQAHNLSLDF